VVVLKSFVKINLSLLAFTCLLEVCSNPLLSLPLPPLFLKVNPLPQPPEVREGVDKIEQLERLDPTEDPGLPLEALTGEEQSEPNG
jgi:hypothetical protein